jgi:hypothetical protein
VAGIYMSDLTPAPSGWLRAIKQMVVHQTEFLTGHLARARPGDSLIIVLIGGAGMTQLRVNSLPHGKSGFVAKKAP